MGIMSDCLVTPERYDIIDTQTNQVVASRLTRKRASAKADKLDLAYGAIRYVVKPVWANESSIHRANNMETIKAIGLYDMAAIEKYNDEQIAYIAMQIRRESAAKTA